MNHLDPLQERIMLVMDDGRERTYDDMINIMRSRFKWRTERQSLYTPARKLVEAGLLRCEECRDVKVFVIA